MATSYNLFLKEVTSSTLKEPATTAEVLEALKKEEPEPTKPTSVKLAASEKVGDKAIAKLTVPSALKTTVEAGGRFIAATIHFNVLFPASESVTRVKFGTVSPAVNSTPTLKATATQEWVTVAFTKAQAEELTVKKLEELELLLETTANKLWKGYELYFSVEVETAIVAGATKIRIVAKDALSPEQSATSTAKIKFASKLTPASRLVITTSTKLKLHDSLLFSPFIAANGKAPLRFSNSLAPASIQSGSGVAKLILRDVLPATPAQMIGTSAVNVKFGTHLSATQIVGLISIAGIKLRDSGGLLVISSVTARTNITLKEIASLIITNASGGSARIHFAFQGEAQSIDYILIIGTSNISLRAVLIADLGGKALGLAGRVRPHSRAGSATPLQKTGRSRPHQE